MAFGGGGVGLLWDLAAVDHASPAFLRVAGAADKAATATGRAQAKIATAGARMSSVGAMMSRRLTLPLLAIGAASVKAATDFNSSMTRIQTQAGASAKDVQTLTKNVLAMKGVQQGPNELAGALYHLKSVGMDNADAMKALKIGSDLAAVGNAKLEDTVNALAGAWRTGIKGATDFHEAAATVNAVVGAGNMKLSDLNEALSTGILPSAKTFGLTFKDVGAALALFTDESVPANVAATRLRMTFSLLAAPSAAAEKQLNKIGITGFQLGQDMRKPDGLITAVGDLKQHLDDAGLHGTAAAQLLSHAFGGGRSSSAILSMINNFDVLKMKQDQVTASIGKYDAAVKTQAATPQAQFKVQLANLEKAGVLLGNQLLPIAIQFAHAITGLAQGFNGLSSGTKHWIAELGVGLLVLGPMLSIVGKLTKAIALMWAAGRGVAVFTAGMRQAVLAEEVMASKAYSAGVRLGAMGRAAVGAGAAVAAIGIGFSIGRMTREASGGAKALGALASVAAGAALGTMIAPGIGTAIGAVVGGLSNLVGGMGAADQAAVALQANIQDLTSALMQNESAIGSTIKAWVAQRIATSGILQDADKLGISYQEVTAAIMGNKTAMADINRVAGGTVFFISKVHGLSDAVSGALHNNRSYNASLVALGQGQRDSAQSASRNADALGNLAAGSHDATAASKTAGGAMASEKTAADGLNFSLKKLTAQYLKTTNAALGIAQSESQFLDSIHSMSQAIKQSNGSLALHNATARAAREQLYGAAQGALAMDNGTRKGNVALLGQIQTLRAHAISAGADAGAVDKILHSLNLMPHDIRTSLHIETADAVASIENFIHTPWKTYVQVVTTGGHAPSGGKAFLASGGPVRGRGTETSDSIPIMGSNNEHMWSAREVRGAGGHGAVATLRAAARSGRRVPGFKDGGPITTEQSGGKKVWVYNGIQYASQMAAENARTRDGQKAKNTGQATSSAIGRIGGTPSNPIDLSTLSIAKVWAQIRAARRTLAADVADGLKSSAAAKFRTQIQHLVHTANHEFGKLRVKIAGGDMRALTKALHGGVSDTRSAFGQLFADLRHADAPGGVLSALRKTEGAMIANQQALASANARLDKMTAYRAQIRGTLAGAFDPTTFGSVQDLGAGLRGATGTNNRYAHELSSLRQRAHGNKALLGFINQLAGSGQTATLQTLFNAGPGGLANIAKDVRAYDKSLGAGANAAATTKFGESVDKQSKDVDRLVSSNRDLSGLIAQLAQVFAESAATGPSKAIEKKMERIATHLERHVHAARRSS